MTRRAPAMAAALIAALLVSGMAAGPAGADERDTSSASVAEHPVLSLYGRSVVGDFQAAPTASSAELPVTAATLHVELPQQVTELGLTSVEFRLRSQSNPIVSVVAPLSAASTGIDVPVDPGTLGRSTPFVDESGRSFLRFSVSATVHGDSRFAPPFGLRPSEGATSSLRLNGTLRLVESPVGTSADSAVLVLTPDHADTFSYTTSYWADPSDPLWVAPGGVVSMDVPSPGPDATADGYLLSRSQKTPLSATLEQSADGTTRISSVIPTDFDTSAALATSGVTAFGATLTSGHDIVDIAAAATIERPLDDGVAISRISDVNRYEGAAAVSKAVASSRVDSVYLASGQNFADALSIAPLAAIEGRPVLLGTTEEDPAFHGALDTVVFATSDVDAHEVVQIGGERSLPAIWRWYLQEAGNGPKYSTDAIAGADRYEVSRNVATYGFGSSGAPTVFIATGRTFADALSAVPAAASAHAPVILVDGARTSLDTPTRALLTRLGARSAVVVGGPASVSAAIEDQLRSLFSPSQVTRYGGADRYDVSQAINSAYFPDTDTAYLAGGEAFADALTGGVLAGDHLAPLYLVHPDCVPGATLDSMTAASVQHVTLFGGPITLGDRVATLQRCP